MTGSVVELRSVDVHFASGPLWARRRVHAAREVSLGVAAGETLGLVGESGSGKTTTGKVCLGLIRPTTGDVVFDGHPFDYRRRARRGALAAVLQHPQWSLNPRLHVGTSVAEPLVIAGIGGREETRRQTGEMLERVGLQPVLAKRYPHELSGGQRQRVAIARALITHPKFVVFDEAVSALDVSVQAQILNLIRELQAEAGFAALFISHDLAAVRYVADRIVVMYAGEVVESATAETLYGRGRHPYTRGLQAASDLIEDEDARLADASEEIASEGCPLTPRCPIATDLCRTTHPALRPLGDTLVACHHPEGRAGQS
ncbi:MAG: ABC transporter ATP-binding protein [Rhodospirillales bacterium]|nr:ABC transporter ATP-binding protein [Rhodospirillales bacterium]